MRSSSRRRRRLARHGPSPFPLPELLLRLTDRWCRRRRSLRRGSRRGWWGRRGPRRRSRRGWRRWCGSRRRCCGRRWRRCRTGRRGCSGWRRRWPRRCRSGRRRGLWSSSGRWALWRLLGLPSGPSSSFACATTSGAPCACDGEQASCIAVRAVVASSTRRSLVMMILVSGKTLARSVVVPNLWGIAINGQPLGRIVAGYQRETLLFRSCNGLHAPRSLPIQTRASSRSTY